MQLLFLNFKFAWLPSWLWHVHLQWNNVYFECTWHTLCMHYTLVLYTHIFIHVWHHYMASYLFMSSRHLLVLFCEWETICQIPLISSFVIPIFILNYKCKRCLIKLICSGVINIMCFHDKKKFVVISFVMNINVTNFWPV